MPVISALLRFLAGPRRDEQGSVMPIVAIMFTSTVITGMAAITIDVGQLTVERRSLQNGSDAAAVALANICATDPTACTAPAARAELDPAGADSVLDGNVSDGTAQFDTRADAICGRNAGTLPACTNPGSNTNLAECTPRPAWLTAAFPFVQTYARTLSSDGTTALPPVFAQVFAGLPPTSSSACARVAWGNIAAVSLKVPVLLSVCEWQKATTKGSLYAVPPDGTRPGYGGAGQPAWPAKSVETGIQLHKVGDKKDHCPYEGKDKPGGFGWGAAGSMTCDAMVGSGDWLKVDPGNSADNSCKTVLDNAIGRTVLLPIFDCVSGSPLSGAPSTWTECDTGTGSNVYYHVAGWSAFYLTGYTIPSKKVGSILPGTTNPCNGTNGCLSGWFTKATIEAADITPPTTGGTNFGLIGTKIAG